MPEHSDLPPPGAVRRALAPFGLRLQGIGAFFTPWTIPGWAVFLGVTFWDLLDYAHRVSFLAEIIEDSPVDPVGFLRVWGWAVGAAWIMIAAWKVTRSQASTKKRERLVNTIVYAALKFEDLLNAQGPTAGQDEAIEQAMKDFRSALHRLAVAMAETVPSWDRSKYTDAIVDAWANLSQFNSGRPFSISLVRDVLSAIYDAEAKSKK